MNIGVDIDGVLLDLERFALDCGTKMCIEKNIDININLEKYFESEKFHWTQEQEDEFWDTYLLGYVQSSMPRKYAPEIIKRLREEGNTICIITARNENGMPEEYYGKMQEETIKWLKTNNIEYDKIFFTTDDDKLNKCKENDIDIMIEDSPTNIKNISKEVKTIKFDCQYNRNIESENIIKAYSWYHIYQIINDLQSK